MLSGRQYRWVWSRVEVLRRMESRPSVSWRWRSTTLMVESLMYFPSKVRTLSEFSAGEQVQENSVSFCSLFLFIIVIFLFFLLLFTGSRERILHASLQLPRQIQLVQFWNMCALYQSMRQTRILRYVLLILRYFTKLLKKKLNFNVQNLLWM